MTNTTKTMSGTTSNTAAIAPADWEGFVRELRAHNPEALERFFDLYFDRVYAYVSKMVNDKHLSEDLTQDIFFNVYRRLDAYDSQRDILPWLYTIATNKVRDHWRSRRHADSQREASLDYEDAAQNVPSEVDTPQVGMEEQERAVRVHAAVAALPKGMRETVVLRAFEGLPFRRIGEMLGRNEAAVRKRYSRALEILQMRLGPQMEPVLAA